MKNAKQMSVVNVILYITYLTSPANKQTHFHPLLKKNDLSNNHCTQKELRNVMKNKEIPASVSTSSMSKGADKGFIKTNFRYLKKTIMNKILF